MSGSVMVRRASGPVAARPYPAWPFLHRVPFRSPRRRPARRGGTLFHAYRARLPARARQAQDARLPFVPLDFFRAGAKRPRGCRFRWPILALVFRDASPFRELFQNLVNKIPSSVFGGP